MGLIAAKIEPNAKEDIVNGLTQALAETAIETLKAQNFHWNVTGWSFGPLHELFQKMYEDHFEAQDLLAERIKAFDAHAEGRYSVYLERSAIEEHDGKTDARSMVEALLADQETLSSTLSALAEVADQHGDWATNDLATGRIAAHDKFAWFLRSHLKATGA
ncbi:DNA starvation/stationary phase protection protein [Aureimonas fodinaquatilis]|uniref:DNA starvation/stationary phase protection protein n=1 Tax=Aureimonas fodinaquatilis TaxID=2565783 RepID=A0A5B0DSG4_9HYPH|nr:DNA starvation/stationary phase protection protein [Aureimonas fodinaquatilis]KAA0969323.1 DNA starvation/stationary phase protection protein [Aureimonas fodinaquatilis]